MDKKIQRIAYTFSNMPYNLYFCFILTLVCINVSCFSNIQQKRTQLMYKQDAVRHSSLNRFRRQSTVLGYKNYMQEGAVRPVVVMPGVECIPGAQWNNPLQREKPPSNNDRRFPLTEVSSWMVPPLYRGPGSSYGPSSSAGVPSGVNGPTVVVNMPDSSSCTKKKKKKKKILM